MLEDFLVPAAARRRRSRLLGPHLDGFCRRLAEAGYRHQTIRSKLDAVSVLARWMEGGHVAVADLDEGRVDEFLDARRRRGRTCRGFRQTALQLLEYLQYAGLVRIPEPAQDKSPAAVLLARYEAYLRQERALARATLTSYLRFVRPFILDRLKGGARPPCELCAQDVRGFLLGRIRGVAPGYAQVMATALRSFLRFLFLSGKTDTDLGLAIPTVRRWRLARVPVHLSAPDVERLLGACDRSSATGRRNYAILLLLARLGLRAGEVVALELDDLRWRDGVIVVRGKGLVQDGLPLVADVGEAIALYLTKDRPPSTSRRVFLCMKAPQRGLGQTTTVTTIVRRALTRASLTPVTRGAHLLRHSLATSMLRQGASLTEIGELLRHRSPNTTEIYAKLDFDALRDVALPWPVPGGAR